MATKPYVYLTCPGCDQRISEPFGRHTGPITFVHRTKRHGSRISCRLLIIPDPNGHRHHVSVIAPRVTLEAALSEALGQKVAA